MIVPQHSTSEEGVYPMRLLSVLGKKKVRVLHMHFIRISQPRTQDPGIDLRVLYNARLSRRPLWCFKNTSALHRACLKRMLQFR